METAFILVVTALSTLAAALAARRRARRSLRSAMGRALETIGRGESLLDPALTQKVFQRVRDASRKAEDEAFAELNNQELKIIALIAEGKSNKAIADHVYLSEKTVRNYVSSILSKLHLSSRAEAAAYAVKHRVQDHLPTD